MKIPHTDSFTTLFRTGEIFVYFGAVLLARRIIHTLFEKHSLYDPPNPRKEIYESDRRKQEKTCFTEKTGARGTALAELLQ